MPRLQPHQEICSELVISYKGEFHQVKPKDPILSSEQRQWMKDRAEIEKKGTELFETNPMYNNIWKEFEILDWISDSTPNIMGRCKINGRTFDCTRTDGVLGEIKTYRAHLYPDNSIHSEGTFQWDKQYDTIRQAETLESAFFIFANFDRTKDTPILTTVVISDEGTKKIKKLLKSKQKDYSTKLATRTKSGKRLRDTITATHDEILCILNDKDVIILNANKQKITINEALGLIR